MDGGEDHHRVFVRRDIGNLLVHIEKVAIAGFDFGLAETVDGLGEVEEHGQSGVVHAVALVTTLLGGTRSHVAGNEVTEGRIAALQIVVAVFLGNILALKLSGLKLFGIFEFFGHPDAAIVTQRL